MGKIFEPLEPLKTEDMPEKTGPNWKLWGPGAILVGLSIGAGEIIIWPRIVAEYGATMVWAAVLGVFLQMWINFEVGRWTIATGETVFTGYCRVWRGFAFVFIGLTLLGWLAPGWGRASGSALKALLMQDPHWHMAKNEAGDWRPVDFWGSDTFWTMLTFVGVGLVLFGPKIIYKSVERTVEVLVVIITLGLIMVAFAVGTADTWSDLGKGMINVGYVAEGISPKAFFIAIVFAGAGGTANLFYTFYLRDKQIGMGARIPSMTNPLRGRSEAAPDTGYLYKDTPENAGRFKSWWRFIRQDQMLFFWFLNSVTMLLFIFGSLAVLHPNGVIPGKGSLIWDEAQILGDPKVWGPTGRNIFLIVGLATLFTTQLTLLDGVSRSIADIIHTNFKGARKREVGWWYLVIAGLWIVAGCGITAVMEFKGVSELGFLFSAAYMGGFAMAVYVPLTLFMNFKYLPKSARPGPVSTVMMVIASCVYVGFAIACLLWEFGVLKS